MLPHGGPDSARANHPRDHRVIRRTRRRLPVAPDDRRHGRDLSQPGIRDRHGAARKRGRLDKRKGQRTSTYTVVYGESCRHGERDSRTGFLPSRRPESCRHGERDSAVTVSVTGTGRNRKEPNPVRASAPREPSHGRGADAHDSPPETSPLTLTARDGGWHEAREPTAPASAAVSRSRGCHRTENRKAACT